MKKIHLTRYAAVATVALLGSTAAWAASGTGWSASGSTLTLQSGENEAVSITSSNVTDIGSIDKIVVQRAGNTATYSTLMLPATVKAGESAQIDAAYFPTSYNPSTTTLNMQLADEIQANKPYLVKVSGSPSSFEFNNVSGYTVQATGAATHSFTLSAACWEFKGVYEKIYWGFGPGNVYGYDAADGQFVKAGDEVTIYPMRAYLTCGNGLGKSTAEEELPEVIKVRFFGKSGETVSIGTMNTRTGDIQMQDRYYDLKGRKLNGKPQNKIMYVNKKVIKH
jgi:hypothetical protein